MFWLQTARSCGYGFIQFAYPEVAKVVADTMNNYLVRDKMIKCRVISPASFNLNIFAEQKFLKKARVGKKAALRRKMHDELKLPDEIHAMRVKALSKLGIDLKVGGNWKSCLSL